MRNIITVIPIVLLLLFALNTQGHSITITLGGKFYLIPASTGTSPTPPGPTPPEPPPETEISLTSLEVQADSPPPEGLFVGQSLQYRATAVLSDNSRQEVTELVTWSTSNLAVASISNQSPTQGVVTALTAGETMITATDPASGIASPPVTLIIQEVPVIECGTVAEINSNYDCVGRIVTLKGYLTERLDSDNYTFYDGTGSTKIEYEGDMPLYTPIEITGKVDGSEIEVSSYVVL